LFTWNDFLFSLMLTGTDTRTLPVVMTVIMDADVGTDWGVFRRDRNDLLGARAARRVLHEEAVAARLDPRNDSPVARELMPGVVSRPRA
jgi:hypothetical protein